jgi:hypothetical protein
VGLTNGVAATVDIFNEIWELTPNTRPASWTWSGDINDLFVQRIHLADLFRPVVLNSTPADGGRFSLDNGLTHQLPVNPFDTFYVRSTVLDLRDGGGYVQAREVVQGPTSFSYEHGVWRGRLFMGVGQRRLAGVDLQIAADVFVNSLWNSNAKNGVTQADVMYQMRRYITNYLAWAENGFPGHSSQKKPFRDAQSDLASDTMDLIFKP